MISAKIIADSKNSKGQRITSFLLVFPRIVLAEFNTHRAISRNSASSRAIPFDKMLEKVMTSPFMPIAWQKDHKGMQGNDYIEDIDELKGIQIEWLKARDAAVAQAKILNKDCNVTKQVVNRLLEPFMYHTVIATATDWENFFALRAHEAAEIHIQSLAFKMLSEYNASEPRLLKDWEWHIPFGENMKDMKIHNLLREGEFKEYVELDKGIPQSEYAQAFQKVKMKIATARCARVSYENYEGGDDYEKDVILHDRLSKMGHWSPFEHCAQADPHGGRSGNFEGFVQYRKKFAGENKSDERVIQQVTEA